MSVPQLRFKEFDGDFEKNKLVEYTKWSSGGTPSKDNEEYWNGDIPLISGASMHTNKLYESDVKITKLGLQKGSKLAPTDSILILVRGSMLFNKIPMGITLCDVAFNQDVKCIQPKEQLSPNFLYQWLSAKENVIQNKVTSTGIGAGKLDTSDLQNLQISIPSKQEQTKIASFLSAVDEKISQLTQKHELLSQYKQGMMQKLFSQQIRFKADDGSEFGEWEEKCLSELFEYANGKSFEAEVVENGKFKLITLNSIDIKANLKKVHKTISNSDNSLIKNDLIMILSDVAHGNFLGLTAIIPDNSYVLNQRVGRLRSRSEINIVFIRFYINFNQKYFKLNGQGSSQLNLSKADILNFPVSLPCIEEQTKIANFLSAIDQKIEVVAQQIEQAKQWKKGLLQQMFV